ncbi:MAG: uroporphyrinogen-III synthase [Bacteroidales bacterium]|jgi:uroporphyrinogen-III synthase
MSSLKNKVIISTRPLSENDAMSEYLKTKSAVILEFPMLEIIPAEINDKIQKSINNISNFNWLIFTSKNGVIYFFNFLEKIKGNKIIPDVIKTAVIGNKTAEELEKNGIKPFFISSGNTSETFLNELLEKHIKTNDNILLVLGKLAGNTIEEGLNKIADITRIDVYRTIETKIYSKKIIGKIKSDNYDIIIFTSPSGFNNFIRIMKENNCVKNFKIACIGKTTEKEILKHGYKPLIVPSKPDGLSLALEIEKYFKL